MAISCIVSITIAGLTLAGCGLASGNFFSVKLLLFRPINHPRRRNICNSGCQNVASPLCTKLQFQDQKILLIQSSTQKESPHLRQLHHSATFSSEVESCPDVGLHHQYCSYRMLRPDKLKN